MKKMLLILIFLAPGAFCPGEEMLSEGKKAYDNGLYEEALRSYSQALLKAPDSPEIFFNQGAVLYKQKKYEEALNLFQKSLQSPDTKLQARAYYNIGNVYFRQQKWKESFESYKKSLEFQPGNNDCKYNLEFVQKKLQDEKKKQEEQKKEQSSQGQTGEQKDSQQASGSDEKQSENKKGENSQASEQEKQGESRKAEKSDGKESADSATKDQSGEQNPVNTEQKAAQNSEKDKDQALQKGDLQKMEEAPGNKDEKKDIPAGVRGKEEKKEGELSREEAARLLMALDSQYNSKGRHSQLRIQDQEREDEHKDYKDW